jgi:Tol biopolymer transport system component
MTLFLLLAAALGHTVAVAGTFPGPNGKIAFASEGHIEVINADGSGRVTLDAASPASTVNEPAWNVAGTKLVFRRGGSSFSSMNADGSNVKPATTFSSFVGNPTWSVYGGVFALDRYIGGPQQESRLYTVFVTASGDAAQQQLADLDAQDPTYSPDGTKIAYEESAGDSSIGVMNADGSGAANITSGDGGNNADFDPSWSPDGTRIAFTRARQIWTMNADGSAATQLTTGTNASYPTWSPDGTQIAFERDADIWVMASDGSGATNVTNTTDVDEVEPDWGIGTPNPGVCIPPPLNTRVSVASDGTQGNGDSGDVLVPDRPVLADAAISASGRFVAFSSSASNLVTGDTNGRHDIFVHDRSIGATTIVSVASDGTQANGGSSAPTISANGRFVAFSSIASNLGASAEGGDVDVFVHDRSTGVTTQVSVAWDGSEYPFPNGDSSDPAISADGRFVAFDSDASNLIAGDTNGLRDVFVHSLSTGATTRVSFRPDGTQTFGASRPPAISADGRLVAFSSVWGEEGTSDTRHDVFVHDRATGVTTRVSGTAQTNTSFDPAISGDGRLVAYTSDVTNIVAGDTNASRDVFVHDRSTGTTTRVSVASDGTEASRGDDSEAPAISADGRLVAFVSDASNLVAGDNNGTGDVFVHNRSTGITTRVSVASDGTQANGRSRPPTISGNGRLMAFSSDASNLVAGDTNEVSDIFVLPDQIFRPDARIKTSGAYVGDNIYDSRHAGQNKSLRISPGKRAVFTIAVQNDGNATDSYRLKGHGAQPGFSVSYLSDGQDVTNRVVAGNFMLARLAPCATETIELVAKANARSRSGTKESWIVTATSSSRARAQDAVKATVTVKP